MTESTERGREQKRVDALYARLDALREETTTALAGVRRAHVGGNHQNRSERDAFATMYEDQLIRYSSAEEGLCFGRIDSADGRTTYIGRIGMSDRDRSQMLMDWRAPASEPFYRATAARPDGVVRRRHIATRRRRVVGVEDDVLDASALSEEARTELQGEGALMAALTARRTGRMGDIVATIQAEQDVIIRRDLAGTLVVQGGPGTGKTAVALHRAAYLLYQHRERIARSGVLIVGPSPVFLRYIEQVLPSLGETGAVMLTPGQLYPGAETSLSDSPETAALKGDLRMVDVVEAVIRSFQRVPDDDQELSVGPHRLTLRRSVVRRARDRARRSGAHNEARTAFASAVVRSLADQLAHANGLDAAGERLAEFEADVRASRDVRVAVNLCWLPLTPEFVLETMLAKPHRLAAAAEGVLTADEQRLLTRPPGSDLTVSDVALLDEIAERIGALDEAGTAEDPELDYAHRVVEMTGTGGLISAEVLAARYAGAADPGTVSERAAGDREWTYGHLIVDEAQELTPMQLRVLFRRVPSKSATLVGDLAQRGRASAATTWRELLSPHVGDRFALERLTVSYRTPGRIMRLADGVLLDHFPDAELPSPVRDGDSDPQIVRLGGRAEVLASLPQIVAAEAEAVAGGRTAVITAESGIDDVARVLSGAPGVDAAAGTEALGHDIAVLTPYGSKGLEFDSVVIVEPGLIMAPGESAAAGDLYVALTRTTSRLTVVGSEPSGLDPHL